MLSPTDSSALQDLEQWFVLKAHHTDDGDIDTTSATVVPGMLCDAAPHFLKPVNSPSGFHT